jgi:hypothetical protein
MTTQPRGGGGPPKIIEWIAVVSLLAVVGSVTDQPHGTILRPSG